MNCLIINLIFNNIVITKSLTEIDKKLCKKYNLSQKELTIEYKIINSIGGCYDFQKDS